MPVMPKLGGPSPKLELGGPQLVLMMLELGGKSPKLCKGQAQLMRLIAQSQFRQLMLVMLGLGSPFAFNAKICSADRGVLLGGS